MEDFDIKVGDQLIILYRDGEIEADRIYLTEVEEKKLNVLYLKDCCFHVEIKDYSYIENSKYYIGFENYYGCNEIFVFTSPDDYLKYYQKELQNLKSRYDTLKKHHLKFVKEINKSWHTQKR